MIAPVMPRSPMMLNEASMTSFCGGLSHLTGSTRETDFGAVPGYASYVPMQPSIVFSAQASRLPRGSMQFSFDRGPGRQILTLTAEPVSEAEHDHIAVAVVARYDAVPRDASDPAAREARARRHRHDGRDGNAVVAVGAAVLGEIRAQPDPERQAVAGKPRLEPALRDDAPAPDE